MHLITLADQLKNDTRKDGKEGTLSPATINYVIRVIKNTLKRAHEWQLIRKNPAKKLTKLKDEYQIKEPYDLEETRQIMSLLEQEETMYQILFHLAIMAGFRRGDLWEAGEYFFVFSSCHGKTLYPSHITKKWNKFTKKHELRHVNFHGLLHTSPTLLLEAGENMKVISISLGHSRINTTIDIYTHSLQSADKGASNKLELLINSIEKIN
ncbi:MULTISPECIES: tyrosine-type recombinase/integrase [Bacillus cereus group]|uniref:tyrosine-type recombinase/integrase n=1 Tax=Bacillus cereus group TaxID=86661 RepID=UPI001CC2275F|nr:tyrosine-type recombinase/integrase [Bacillus cereus]